MIKDFNVEFQKLNDYQQKALKYNSGHVLLKAAVGSGKTTVITGKVLYLIENLKLDLKDIMLITFTNRAAAEIKDRLAAFLGMEETDNGYVGTFHSVGKRLLEESSYIEELGYSHGFEILDTEASFELMQRLIDENSLLIKYKNKLKKRLEEYKNGKKLFGVMKKGDDIDELYRLYCDEKKRINVMDFDDIIDNVIRLPEYPIKPKWLLVDEFQDTDDRQYRMIKRFADKGAKVFAVGDPYQTIYSWRTGVTNISERFVQEYKPQMLQLPLNYRSGKSIIEAANSIIGDGNIKGKKDEDNPIYIRKFPDALNEALFIAGEIKRLIALGESPSQIGVLYRRKAQEMTLLETFMKEEVPCEVLFSSKPSYESDEEEKPVSTVKLLTLHSSKGLEFNHVYIVGVNMGNIPLSSKRQDEEEEARLFFVGITRAKENLSLSYLSKSDIHGFKPYPSPYISMLPERILIREDVSTEKGLKQLMEMLKESIRNKENDEPKRMMHDKYGTGEVTYEDDDVIRIDFEGYGEKEFSKLFSPLKPAD